MRLDVFLREKYGYSREYAKGVIESGKITVNGSTKGVKPSLAVSENDEVRAAEGTEPKYAGRGGFKLEKAIKYFDIKLNGLVCVDVGASTGGFTDCMLQNGAEKVYAIDVGTGQLAEKLKNNPRVISMEQTNVNNAVIPENADFISVDVSFVSLSAVVDVVYNLLAHNGSAVMLVKPQFEAGKGNVGKKGIVKDKKVHRSVLKNTVAFVKQAGFSIKGIVGSPIKGGDGNIEYLMYTVKNGKMLPETDINGIVDSVFSELGKRQRYD